MTDIGVEQCERCGLFARPGASTCDLCGGAVRRAGLPRVIDGRYQLELEIGRGAMGVVYRAHEESLRREVALKVLAGEVGGGQSALTHFQREAAAVASLRSENVVQVYSFGHAGRVPWFAMEYVRGRALDQVIADHLAHGELVPTRRSLGILRKLARGLDAVHAAGIVHRDVKPANVVVEVKTGRPVLVDFGLSVRSGDGDALERGFVAGTPGYIAPEQIQVPQEAPSASTDQYALACLAFLLLTGKPPFVPRDTTALLRAHRDDPPLLPSEIRPEAGYLDAVFTRALAKRPRGRFASCSELVRALGEAHAAYAPFDFDVDSEAPPSLGTGAKKVVLVVDDDPALRKLLVAAAGLVFVGADVDIVPVADGTAAVSAARRRMPVLALLDYDMPGMNGVEALTRIRELPGGGDVRVLVVSASADVADVRWRFDVLGADDFLRKPFQLRDVVDAIGRAREGLV